MPAGGRLRIETRNDDDGDVPGVVVAVTDTGQGMDQATAAHIFEPFFTTRSEGTGLGLAMVYGFVTQSGGRVAVATNLGGGTTFTVWLPRAGEDVSRSAATPEATDVHDGSETVLLVEDEDAVRALARVVLQGRGYTVLEAADGEEAMLLAAEHKGVIHLLVSDVVMPRMSGPQLAGLLSRERPDLRVLFVSGYTDEAMLHLGGLRSDVNILQKPFDPVSLARRVREVLDAQR
jgi:two-component system cell cycle sensor histidine kinase/response regulator CckA